MRLLSLNIYGSIFVVSAVLSQAAVVMRDLIPYDNTGISGLNLGPEATWGNFVSIIGDSDTATNLAENALVSLFENLAISDSGSAYGLPSPNSPGPGWPSVVLDGTGTANVGANVVNAELYFAVYDDTIAAAWKNAMTPANSQQLASDVVGMLENTGQISACVQTYMGGLGWALAGDLVLSWTNGKLSGTVDFDIDPSTGLQALQDCSGINFSK